MSWIWGDKKPEKAIEVKSSERPVEKVRQNVTMKINLNIEYPFNVDLVNEVTKAEITFDLPEGITLHNAKMLSLDLL